MYNTLNIMTKQEIENEAKMLISKYGIRHAEDISRKMCTSWYNLSTQYAEHGNDRHDNYCKEQLNDWLEIDEYICKQNNTL